MTRKEIILETLVQSPLN